MCLFVYCFLYVCASRLPRAQADDRWMIVRRRAFALLIERMLCRTDKFELHVRERRVSSVSRV